MRNKMQSLIVGSVLFVLMVSSTSALNIRSSFDKQMFSRGDTLYVGGGGPGNYTKIQDAVTASSDGDTIIVYPGIYYENQIIINKALTVLGEKWQTTIIDGSDATLTSDGLVRITASGDVTFEGFTVRNAGGPSGFGGGDNKENMGIVVYSSVPDVTYFIVSNKIIGTGNPNDDYDWGFYAVSGGKENIVFTGNVVTQTGCNNMVIEKTTGSTDISFNTLDAGCWGIDSIYYMTYSGVDVTTMQTVANNTIDVGTGINPGGGNKVTGIGFSSAFLGSTGVPDSGRYTGIRITGNIINNVKAWRRGIAIDNFAWDNGEGGEISNVLIKNNIINSVSTAPTSFGIRLSGLVTNTSILENQVTNCDMSFWGRAGYYGESTGYPTSTRVNYNCFMENSQGLVWEGPTILDAEYNWWGNASGPKHPDNPNGTGDAITGEVDFTPWLTYYGPENTIPVVSIMTPVQGYVNINILNRFTLKFKAFTTIAIGKVLVSVLASDNQSGIQKVEFYVDDDYKTTVTAAPYEWRWSDRGLLFPYVLKVVAYDNYGNQNSADLKVWKIF